MPKTRLARRLAALALLLVAASSANAQRPALVSDVDAAVRAPYSETSLVNCSFLSCGIAFSVVPAGHRREIDFVSCGIFGEATIRIYDVELDGLKDNLLTPSPRIYIPALAYPGFTGRFNATANTLAFFPAGVAPFVSVTTTTPVGEFGCTISGREVAI